VKARLGVVPKGCHERTFCIEQHADHQLDVGHRCSPVPKGIVGPGEGPVVDQSNGCAVDGIQEADQNQPTNEGMQDQ